ncbi:MAG: HlyD family type I secretion periplasmic adaptor subunit [Candidatus Thiodiazotropha sp. (ex Dulcina madagascariensis)]|nr:HlyD family type I secretion periplasmic adaptor subunit [Candidatus Thiodiazotropha sp. (ex Dulcina madagascariensis)]
MSSTASLFLDAWKNRHKLGDRQKSRELAAFLPAALEIQEAPPNPIARWLARALIAFMVLVVVWALFGEVNIVATAQGKILPSARVKVVQPLDKSVISKILVAEGEYVAKGQPLIELDSTLTGADRNRLINELHSARMKLSVNRALLTLLSGAEKRQAAIDPIDADVKEVWQIENAELYEGLLKEKWRQYEARHAMLQSTVRKAEAEQAATQAMIRKLQQTLPIVTRRAEKLKALHEKQFASEMEYLQLKQERIEKVQDLEAEKQRLKQLHAVKDEALRQVEALTAETKTAALAEIAEMQRQVSVLREELTKATDLNARQVLYAPVSGRVQELTVTTHGEIVTEAQPLMNIVPDESSLAVEVFLENKDIGFVEQAMPAEIKIHTFPFTKYGVIEAVIDTISDDATIDKERGLLYRMLLTMRQDTIKVKGKAVKLMPGMEVTAEIKTGKRRLIEYFLAPLLQHGKESLRER